MRKYCDLYRSEETVAHIHSGIAAATFGKFSTEPNPLRALKQTQEEINGNALSSRDTTVLYVNAAIGGGIELVARGLLKNPIIKKVAELQISHFSQAVYERADWNESGAGEEVNQFLRDQTTQKRETLESWKGEIEDHPERDVQLLRAIISDAPAGNKLIEAQDKLAREVFGRDVEDLTPTEQDELYNLSAKLYPDLFRESREEDDEIDKNAGIGND